MSDGIVGDYAAGRGISRDAAYAELGAHVPLPGPCEPEEIASACLFLASSDAAGITGIITITSIVTTSPGSATSTITVRARSPAPTPITTARPRPVASRAPPPIAARTDEGIPAFEMLRFTHLPAILLMASLTLSSS